MSKEPGAIHGLLELRIFFPMVSFSLLGLQHPEPNGSRRATPTSTFQHRPGHLPAGTSQHSTSIRRSRMLTPSMAARPSNRTTMSWASNVWGPSDFFGVRSPAVICACNGRPSSIVSPNQSQLGEREAGDVATWPDLAGQRRRMVSSKTSPFFVDSLVIAPDPCSPLFCPLPRREHHSCRASC